MPVAVLVSVVPLELLLRVSVFAPIANAPLVSVRAPVTVSGALSVTPVLFEMVRVLTVAGSASPVTWAAVPLYV